MDNLPITPPLLIRSLAEYKWEDALTKLAIENKDYYIIDKINIWLYTIERDINNKLYAYQNIYKNNILISSLYTKLPYSHELNNYI